MWDGDDCPIRKILGRPKGKKDNKPRKYKGPPSKDNQFEKEEKSVLHRACQGAEQRIKHSNVSQFEDATAFHFNKMSPKSSTGQTNSLDQQKVHSMQCNMPIYAPSLPMQLPSIESVKAHCLASMKYSPLSIWKDCAGSQCHFYTSTQVPAMQLSPRAMTTFYGSWPSYPAQNFFPC
jgi:hypothetical protein